MIKCAGNWDNNLELIRLLKRVIGSSNHDGDCSAQVLLPLMNGRFLRVGITDPDVAECEGLWFDITDLHPRDAEEMRRNRRKHANV